MTDQKRAAAAYDEIEPLVLEHIARYGQITRRELSNLYRLAPHQSGRFLSKLVSEGKLVMYGKRALAYYKLPNQTNNRAPVSDLQSVRLRKMEAQARMIELELARREGRLLDVDVVKKLIHRLLPPIAQRIRQLPGEMARACNPIDPTMAHQALESWVDNVLKLLQVDLDAAIRESVSEETERPISTKEYES